MREGIRWANQLTLLLPIGGDVDTGVAPPEHRAPARADIGWAAHAEVSVL